MITVDKSHGELYAASPAPYYGNKGVDAFDLLNDLRGRCKYGK